MGFSTPKITRSAAVCSTNLRCVRSSSGDHLDDYFTSQHHRFHIQRNAFETSVPHSTMFTEAPYRTTFYVTLMSWAWCLAASLSNSTTFGLYGHQRLTPYFRRHNLASASQSEQLRTQASTSKYPSAAFLNLFFFFLQGCHLAPYFLTQPNSPPDNAGLTHEGPKL